MPWDIATTTVAPQKESPNGTDDISKQLLMEPSKSTYSHKNNKERVALLATFATDASGTVDDEEIKAEQKTMGLGIELLKCFRSGATVE